MDDKKNMFQSLGSDESAVCGPEGCNIDEHRAKEAKKQEDKKN
ncbi:hypothetical protein COSHB9_10390 [Companilactobacillus alimentarius]|nr:hypothetical protein [Companilactobacillus alimentarius]MDT6952663.1 hypothetical protein [Companilactobacillus alimentarius]GEO44903.1 hypothetical protein LAL01_11350 [Companilactobacillus alimentarius]